MESEEELGFKPWAEPGDKFVVADSLADNIKAAAKIKSWDKVETVKPADLDIVCAHPLKNMDGADGKYDFAVPLFDGEHVTAEAGTGFVHTAPSHGDDDYGVWISNQLKLEEMGIDPVVPMTLDDDGCYTDVMPERFQGLDVIRTSGKKRGQDGKANPEVLKALMECGNLLARGITMLRDAHSWRSKAPVIRRATPQWFVSMSKDNLREKALKAISDTKWYPARGENRIRAMVEDRPDWLISRQRNWGVPITLIVNDETGQLHTELDEADQINARILAAVNETGVDGWFDTPVQDLMGNVSADGWTKVTDILDVWFDSGSTHAFCLEQRDDLPWPADLYMEGTDQHRGWFQSSLLEACATRGKAPYKGVLTHGFVMADDGRKMSKSLGNTVEPEQITKQFGADIMRLWVASSDFTEDLRIGDEIIKTNVDAYRKLRNTLRYMVGALDGYDAKDTVDYADMPALEKWVLHRLTELDTLVRKSLAEHDYKRVFSNLFNFCTNDLSAFYFDIRKDALYCDPLGSTRRRACRTVMDHLYNRLTLWLAPILCFTMEEVWHARHGDAKDSVHMQEFPDTPESWKNTEIALNMKLVQGLRDEVLAKIEPLRAEGDIRSSLEAKVALKLNELTADALVSLVGDLDGAVSYPEPAAPTDLIDDYLIVSEVAWKRASDTDGDNWIDILILSTDDDYSKCERSWKYFKPAGDETITPRDAIAVKEWDAYA